MSKLLGPEEFEDAIFANASDIWWKQGNLIRDYFRDKPTNGGALIFALDHCFFADRFPRWFGNIIGNCPELRARRYMIENMYVEEVNDPTIGKGHYESLVDFAVALGANPQAVYDHPGSIEMRLATSFMDNVSRTKPWLVAFAHVGGLEMLNGARLCARNDDVPFNAKSNFRKLNLPDEYMTHWDAAEAADPGEEGHGEETLRILYEYATTPELQQQVIAAQAESTAIFRNVYNVLGERAYAHDGVTRAA
jgi:pyrroloquinoline quinone (PQQ) biosynthesis protein C